MTTIPLHQKNKIIELYLQGMGMKQIGEELGYSLNAVYYFMRKHRIARRDLVSSAKIRFDQKPLSFTIPSTLSPEQERLKLLGVTLYWAEGYKTNKSAGIDFANCDTAMQIVFLRFLREVCHIDEKRITLLLYSHDEQKVPEQIHYWSRLLKIPKENFSKPYIAKSTSGLEKKSKMPYGLVHLRYADKKLLWQILDWIEELKQ